MKPERSVHLWRCRKSILVALTLFAFALPQFGAEAPSRGLALFNDYIGPLLRERCYECHSHEGGKAKGGLVLDSQNGWAKGGEHGPAIVLGKPNESLLLRAVSQTDPDLKMPPKSKLTEDEISKLRNWIALGAPDPRLSDPVVQKAPQEHWSFRADRRPQVPELSADKKARFPPLQNPIDAFICQKLAEHGLTLAPEADRRTLIRRLNFDLLGLPPSPSEIDASISDRSPLAHSRLIDRLLDSPHFGERWGRHWLDVAGFAESSMFIGDQVRPGFWRYRDYVIRAFNTDKPYNRFVMEQIAGDELFDWRSVEAFTPEQIDILAATGFLRCPPDATDNQAITQQEKIFPAQQQAMEVSMKAVMGLSLNCVRCHSHKYDPIPHEDYYRLIAIFQAAYDPEKWLPGIWSDPHPGPIRAIPIMPRAARDDYDRQSRAWPKELLRLQEEVNGGLLHRWRDPELTARATEIEDEPTREKLLILVGKPARDRAAEEEKFLGVQAEKLGITASALEKRFSEFSNSLSTARARLEQIKAYGKKLPPVIWATFDVSTNPSPAHLLRRGEYEQPGPEVSPGVLGALDSGGSFRISPPSCSESTGRRLALARWLTRRDHPLTARVIVNRIWQYHFGTGLVATPDDFGARGARPTHPELLDWLAAELMDHNWSLKRIHRLILNSATYRQSSHNPKLSNGDAQSEKLLAQFPRHRLEGEIVRDTMLELAGELDLRFFGESIPTQRQPDGRSVVSTNSPDRNRRSVYISTRRTTVPTFLGVFDTPAMDTNWSKRNDSVIPQQALALMNSSFVLECSEQFARRLLREPGASFNLRLRRAFLLAYGRLAQPDEIEMLKVFCAAQERQGEGRDKAWTAICHALLSSNEFLYVD